jgi:hypothetical protein
MSQRFLPTLRRFLRRTSCCAILAALLTWGICPPSADAQVAHTSYLNITSKATTLVKSGAGVLVSVCVNTPNATETIAIYDGLTASGTLIGTITVYASTNPCFSYNVNFMTGLTIVTAVQAGDITVAYQ